jgi:hypothetical protein
VCLVYKFEDSPPQKELCSELAQFNPLENHSIYNVFNCALLPQRSLQEDTFCATTCTIPCRPSTPPSLPGMLNMYREDFYFVCRFHGSVLHGDRCTAGCEAHMNFADESACLKASPEIGTSSIDWTQLSRFQLKMETESSFRNTVFCNIHRKVFLD